MRFLSYRMKTPGIRVSGWKEHEKSPDYSRGGWKKGQDRRGQIRVETHSLNGVQMSAITSTSM